VTMGRLDRPTSGKLVSARAEFTCRRYHRDLRGYKVVSDSRFHLPRGK